MKFLASYIAGRLLDGKSMPRHLQVAAHSIVAPRLGPSATAGLGA
jgi:hypothetical protein